MFEWFKKRKVNDPQLLEKIKSDGVKHAGKRFAEVIIDQHQLDSETAYLFILQELDGARQGDLIAKNFALNSGIDKSEYIGAMQSDMPEEVDNASMFLVALTQRLLPEMDIIRDLRLEILDNVMKIFYLGKYSKS